MKFFKKKLLTTKDKEDWRRKYCNKDLLSAELHPICFLEIGNCNRTSKMGSIDGFLTKVRNLGEKYLRSGSVSEE